VATIKDSVEDQRAICRALVDLLKRALARDMPKAASLIANSRPTIADLREAVDIILVRTSHSESAPPNPCIDALMLLASDHDARVKVCDALLSQLDALTDEGVRRLLQMSPDVETLTAILNRRADLGRHKISTLASTVREHTAPEQWVQAVRKWLDPWSRI
jgi:hypothetical protein